MREPAAFAEWRARPAASGADYCKQVEPAPDVNDGNGQQLRRFGGQTGLPKRPDVRPTRPGKTTARDAGPPDPASVGDGPCSESAAIALIVKLHEAATPAAFIIGH
ncbi:hypothetical protein [Burkholderia sp. WAC0059]|uniref:hypothetical protein n=1 Tax=Burkholderia sp. WAC0059 TaxID=2066022 RepID=UPI0011AF9F01|nr:hypothetical protein [Burkholderia sp. WAC0059]